MCRCVGGIASGSSKLAPNATCAPLTNPNCEASKILTRPGNLSAFAMICASSLGCTPVVVSVTLGSCTFPTSLFSDSMCSHLIRDLSRRTLRWGVDRRGVSDDYLSIGTSFPLSLCSTFGKGSRSILGSWRFRQAAFVAVISV